MLEANVTLNLRKFPVVVKCVATGEVRRDEITVDKETLEAARRVGQSSRELIYRMYRKAGFRVLEIGKPERGNFTISLNELFETGKKAQR